MKKRYLLLPLAIALASVGGVRGQALPCTNPITTYPYFENFENGAGGWTSGADAGSTNSWALGTPAKTVITGAASGQNAWITDLQNTYPDDEHSYVVSPCYNFSSLALPTIEMKIWWNMEFSWDGVVLQSSIDGGTTWQNVGAMGDPENWYTDNSIGGNPGGQQEGWTGRALSNNGSGGYVLAKHPLTGLAGQTNVRLRLAFGTDLSGVDDGFAFDDIRISQPAANDVGVTAFTSPVSGTSCALGSPQNVTVTIRNFGSAAQSNIPVSYTINSGTPVTAIFPGPLAPGATASFTFPTQFTPAAQGTFAFTARTTLVGDGNATNDQATGPTYTIISPISSFPYFQNFENGAGGWVSGADPGSATNSWALGTPAKPVINGAASGQNAWVTGLTGSYVDNENSYVVGPCFNFSSLGLPIFEMKIWWNAEFSWDGAVLQSSIDGGTTWQNVGTVGDPDNWYNDNSIGGNPGGQQEGWTGRALTTNGSGGYVVARHAMPNLAGQSSVRLRIAFGTDGSGVDDGIAFDDIRIYQPAPNDVGVAAITAPVTATSCAVGGPQNVVISVRNYGSAPQSNFPVSYTINSGTPVTATFTGTLAPGATASFTFPTQFTPAAAGVYTFTARTSLPGDADATNDQVTGPTYTIINPIATFPYQENFDNGAGGWVSGGTASTWALGNPNKSVIAGAFSAPNSWVTSLTGSYVNSEASAVVSPCFDFSQNPLPGIEMQVWWASDAEDGAVLQGSIDNGLTWITIGVLNDPENWYNNNTIDGTPGGSRSGWAGNGGAGSGGWVLAKHAMPQLGGQPSVRLRIAFGSDFFTTGDGFAFDNVNIVALTPPPPPPANDLSVVSILSPTTSCSLTNAEPVSVLITNFGTQPQSNFPITVDITFNGQTRTLRTTYTSTLLPGASNTQIVTFSRLQDFSARGCYTLRGYATLANDQVTGNDTTTVEVCNELITAYPYNQNFEASTGGWYSTGGTWALGTPAKSVIQGAASGSKAWVTGGLGTGRYSAVENSAIESPCFNLAALANPVVQLKLWWSSEQGRDGASLQYTIDNGITWTTIGAFGDPDNWYNSATVAATPGGNPNGWSGSGASGSGGWVLARHDLAGTPAAGQAQVRFRLIFSATSGNPPAGNDVGDGIGFDDFAIYEKPDNDLAIVSLNPIGGACGFRPSECIVVNVKNTGTQPASNFTVSYVLNGQAAVTGTVTQTIQPGDQMPVQIGQCRDLSGFASLNLQLSVNLPGDQISFNNSLNVIKGNVLRNTVPFNTVDFETPANNSSRLSLQAAGRAAIVEQSGRGVAGSVALVMTGGGAPWTDPIGPGNSPWQLNPDHLATATLCLDPTGIPASSPLHLRFDLRQVATGSGALFSNTNFRVLINNTQVGATYQPPIANPGTGTYSTKDIDLAPYRGSLITIQFQSSVFRGFVGNSGDANFLDNVRVETTTGLAADAFAQGISVYPNPSTGIFQVELDHEGARAYSLTVTDLSGRVVRTHQLSAAGHTESALDLTTLARGIYMLRVIDDAGHSAVRKLTLE